MPDHPITEHSAKSGKLHFSDQFSGNFRVTLGKITNVRENSPECAREKRLQTNTFLIDLGYPLDRL